MFIIASSIFVFGQEKVVSKADQFSSKSGTLFQKEYINIGKIRTLEIQVLKVTDLISGAKVSGLLFQFNSYDNYNHQYIAKLDLDEIDGLIKSIKTIQSTVFPSVKANYTEFIFRSRTGFEFGTYYDQSELKWKVYVQLDKNLDKSLYRLNIDDVPILLALINKAQGLLINL